MLTYIILGVAAVFGLLLLFLVCKTKTTEKPAQETPVSSASSVDALSLENQEQIEQPLPESASSEETEDSEQN